MANEKLNEYIKKCIELGKQEEEITNNLLGVGWKKGDIDEAFSVVRGQEESVPEPEKTDDDLSNSLNNEINAIQEEGGMLNKEYPKEDLYTEPLENEEKTPSFSEKPQENQNLPEEPQEGGFVDFSEKKDDKKIILPIIIIVIVLLLAGTGFLFVQKIGPFSFLAQTPEVVTDVDDQEDKDVPEDDNSGAVEWSCGDDLVDQRNGRSYLTVKIGSQCWMAKNLNYSTEGSSCYNDEEENCDTYGALYDWNAAVSACPIGWSLPSDSDFKMLERFLGMEEQKINTMDWREVPEDSESTISSLDVVLSGSQEPSGEYKYLDEYANFWAYSMVDDSHYARAFRAEDNSIYRENIDGDYKYSVRCMKY